MNKERKKDVTHISLGPYKKTLGAHFSLDARVVGTGGGGGEGGQGSPVTKSSAYGLVDSRIAC